MTGNDISSIIGEPNAATFVDGVEGRKKEISMSTFNQGTTNAKETASASVDKDAPTADQIKAADTAGEGELEVPAGDPNKPTELLDESLSEAADRHIASTELTVGQVTPPETQSDSALAQDAKDKIVAGAGVGPDVAGVVRNEHGRVAYAPPGSLDAAFNGVQEDAAGHVDSVGTDNSSKSGVRI